MDDAEGFAKLEELSRQQVKIPIKKKGIELDFININRSDPIDFFNS